MSLVGSVTDWQVPLRSTVKNGLINAQEFEFVEKVAEESDMTEEWRPFTLVWLLAMATPRMRDDAPDDVHPYLYLAGEMVSIPVADCSRILPGELAPHTNALIAMQRNLDLLDGLESQDAIAALVHDASGLVGSIKPSTATSEATQ